MAKSKRLTETVISKLFFHFVFYRCPQFRPSSFSLCRFLCVSLLLLYSLSNHFHFPYVLGNYDVDSFFSPCRSFTAVCLSAKCCTEKHSCLNFEYVRVDMYSFMVHYVDETAPFVLCCFLFVSNVCMCFDSQIWSRSRKLNDLFCLFSFSHSRWLEFALDNVILMNDVNRYVVTNRFFFPPDLSYSIAPNRPHHLRTVPKLYNCTNSIANRSITISISH